jgi:hypothetical protein
VKEHLLNPALKLATPFYDDAPYVAYVEFYYSSYTASVGGSTVGVSTVDYWTNGEQPTDGCPYAYSSTNTSVATVTKNGCVGVLTAVAVGSASIYADEDDVDDGEGDYGELDAAATEASVCAVPTNFAQGQTVSCNPQTGALGFQYTWSSTSGVQSDLATCTIQETVSYSNNGVPMSPPFPANSGFTNPTLIPASQSTRNGNSALFTDNQLAPSGSFVKPYSETTFTGNQNYQYNCACQNTTNWTIFTGFQNIQIVRRVTNPSGTWLYKVTKSGSSCAISIPQ